MSKELGAILIGAAVAGAAVLLLRRASAPKSGELSACEKAAAIAEKLQPGAGAAVLASCALLDKTSKAVGKVTGAATSTVIGVVTGWGQRDRIDLKACPKGSHGQIYNRELEDHRGFADNENHIGSRGSVCIDDASGEIIGSLAPDGFHPFATPKPSAPLLALASSGGGRSRDPNRGPQGGVSVS